MSYSPERRKMDSTLVLIGAMAFVTNFAVLIFDLALGTWWLFPIPIASMAIIVGCLAAPLRRLIENPKEKK